MANLLRSYELSNLGLGSSLLKGFHQSYNFDYLPRVFLRAQLVRQFLNNREVELLWTPVKRKKPYVIYTLLRLLFQALTGFSPLHS